MRITRHSISYQQQHQNSGGLVVGTSIAISSCHPQQLSGIRYECRCS